MRSVERCEFVSVVLLFGVGLVLFSVVGSVAFCCCLGPLHFVSGFQKTKEAERKPRTDLLTYTRELLEQCV
jgi:hypothetical protein